uniref:Uncharacterized protein n=1 Tax=Knipowitschia caucasica TaxID=637954 RepID=A0AAV2L1H5_KNICA
MPNNQAEKGSRDIKQVHRSGKRVLLGPRGTRTLKPVPESWIPALGVQRENERLVPDENGQLIPGVELPAHRCCPWDRSCWAAYTSGADRETKCEKLATP